MKRIQNVSLAVLLLCTSVAGATEPDVSARRDSVVSLAIAPDDWRNLTIEGERVVSPRMTLGLGVLVAVRQEWLSTVPMVPEGARRASENSLMQVGLIPRLRYFLTGTAPEGLWLSPGLELTYRWGRWREEPSPISSQSTSSNQTWALGGRLMLGYTAILGPGVTLQAGAGIGVEHAWKQHRNTLVLPSGEGLQGGETTLKQRVWALDNRMTLAMGWAF